ncbi:filament-like plant protein 3 isoform X1 [Amaranthus tricolor]|uniref:filament-like plant protein 3 isoform X1 n=1 Tax=Amaranthus tricolor TaxID=29722 RepID=UPI00258E12BE|nr:filament-like plant protein 3 isoform X1 [Amaranthus tricolor]XP_057549996.1 filament-like plant protein 3 isoform X1 [Amaranthus tricolor]XP_057549997.1 filament-like plant protein 3 isoform X1 [Amaranthus tricolor]
MDRRSWLWRRRSSDKCPGAETDSSGSISSPSERFSDEHQASPNQTTQSPEVTSKVAPHDEDVNDGVNILTKKLSAAVATISAKEELVKQHAKVAEEAVAGWEKAENEVVILKQQLDAASKKNLSLEDRILHLDGALKECLRQLRQVRDEKDEKTEEAICKKAPDSESKKCEFEVQISDLLAQLETANGKLEAAASLESDLRLKLGYIEKENTSLQMKLRSRVEELKIRTLERDLSTKTAETASKQHLESIKRVAKLEAECRRLKTMARKVTSCNDSTTDGQSDYRERLTDCEPNRSDLCTSSHKVEKTPSKTHMPPPLEINLMDDFLEMEMLAALPENENNRSFERATSIDEHSNNNCSSLKLELDTMIKRAAEREEKIEFLETEKVSLASALTQCQDKLKLSEAQLNTCQNQLKISQAQLREANKKLGMLQDELDLANELRQAIDLELDDANVRKEEAESRCKVIEDERESLLSKVSFLEGEAEKETALCEEASMKCRTLEDELSRMKHEYDTWKSRLESANESREALEREHMSTTAKKEAAESQLKDVKAEALVKCRTLEDQLASMNESKEALERELMSTTAQKEAAESQLKDVNAEAKSLLANIGSLEEDIGNERRLSEEFSAKCKVLENELSRMKNDAETWKSQLTSANDLKDSVNEELQMINAKKEEAESQLKEALAKVGSLEHEVENERALSADFASKCRKLEYELSKIKSEACFQVPLISKEELNKQQFWQEKELAVAANKLAECQKTIASLGNQLKSLASLEDIFLESERLMEVSGDLPLSSSVISDTLTSESYRNTSSFRKEIKGKSAKYDAAKKGLSSLSLDSKQDEHGYVKLFARTKSIVRS